MGKYSEKQRIYNKPTRPEVHQVYVRYQYMYLLPQVSKTTGKSKSIKTRTIFNLFCKWYVTGPNITTKDALSFCTNWPDLLTILHKFYITF